MGGQAQSSKRIADGPIKMANFFFFKKKKVVSPTHDLINMWIFYARSFLGCFQMMRQCPKSEKIKTSGDTELLFVCCNNLQRNS
jgi:hypothetical protein